MADRLRLLDPSGALTEYRAQGVGAMEFTLLLHSLRHASSVNQLYFKRYRETGDDLAGEVANAQFQAFIASKRQLEALIQTN